MTEIQELKSLVTALCEAMGYEVERVEDWKSKHSLEVIADEPEVTYKVTKNGGGSGPCCCNCRAKVSLGAGDPVWSHGGGCG